MFGIDDIVGQGLKLVNKFVKDPAEAMEHERELKKLAQEGKLEELRSYVSLLQGQVEINKIEAASTSLFKSGWRPFVGWVCGTAFAYKFILQPFFVFIVVALFPEKEGIVNHLPELEWTELSTVLLGMLGLSWNRSTDKKNGVTHR